MSKNSTIFRFDFTETGTDTTSLLLLLLQVTFNKRTVTGMIQSFGGKKGLKGPEDE